MSKVKITGNASGTGTLTIAAPNTNTDTTITLPETTGGEFVVSNTDGKVGIGTDSPASKLHIHDSANLNLNLSTDLNNANIRMVGSDAGSNIIYFGDATNNIVGSIAYWHGDDSLRFTTNGTDSMRIDNSGNLKFNSGYGTWATAYGCRAWVDFDGTGTVAINGSGNVSSISDMGTGNYKINFSTAMPDTNYAGVTASQEGTFNGVAGQGITYRSTAFIYFGTYSSGVSRYDSVVNEVAIFR